MILHPDKREFLHRCLDVLDKYGKRNSFVILGKELDGNFYEDNLILIQKSDDNRWMEIVRKNTNFSFYYMQDGTTIYFHGEYVYLEDHINKLLGK